MLTGFWPAVRRYPRRYPFAAALLVIVLAIAATGWLGDYRGCKRDQPTRRGLNQASVIELEAAAGLRARAMLEPTAAAAALDRRRAADDETAAVLLRVPKLSCLTPVP